MKLSVSILNSKDRKEMIDKLNNTNISYIHCDYNVKVEQNGL